MQFAETLSGWTIVRVEQVLVSRRPIFLPRTHMQTS